MCPDVEIINTDEYKVYYKGCVWTILMDWTGEFRLYVKGLLVDDPYDSLDEVIDFIRGHKVVING